MENTCSFCCANPAYSTTRRLTAVPPGGTAAPLLTLPERGGRQGEGGLRTRGLFKHGGEPPLVTVVTAVYNGAPHLQKTIESVLRQSYHNVEYLVIDGGSRDGTVEILRGWEGALDYWVSEPDLGVYDAWNKGVALAAGDWIAFLGADDRYLEGALQGYLEHLAHLERGGAPPEYLSSRAVMEYPRRTQTFGERWEWSAFRRYMNVAHVGSLHNRALFRRYGAFDVSYRVCGDYEFLLRPGPRLRAGFVDRVTVGMGAGGISSRTLAPFRETARAKATTGGRAYLPCLWEEFEAIARWQVRRCLWG